MGICDKKLYYTKQCMKLLQELQSNHRRSASGSASGRGRERRENQGLSANSDSDDYAPLTSRSMKISKVSIFIIEPIMSPTTILME